MNISILPFIEFDCVLILVRDVLKSLLLILLDLQLDIVFLRAVQCLDFFDLLLLHCAHLGGAIGTAEIVGFDSSRGSIG